jgi:small subunit ribosomal protein S3Ae
MAIKSAGLKVKTKNWFKIFAPKSFNNEVIGETLVDSVENLMGKSVSLSLSILTGDMKKQGIIVKFKVTSIRPEGGNSDIVGYEMLPATIRRFMRRAVTDIANSFECITADNVRIRIKPVAFVSNRIKGSVFTVINKTAKLMLIKAIRSMKYVDVFNDVIFGKLQREVKEKLNNIYPVRIFEIKALYKVEGEGSGELAEEDISGVLPEETAEAAEQQEESEIAAEQVDAVAEPEEIRAE